MNNQPWKKVELISKYFLDIFDIMLKLSIFNSGEKCAFLGPKLNCKTIGSILNVNN